MSTKIILVEPRLAVASPKPKQAKLGDPSSDQLLMGASGLLLLLLIGLAVFTKLKLDDLSKKLKCGCWQAGTLTCCRLSRRK